MIGISIIISLIYSSLILSFFKGFKHIELFIPNRSKRVNTFSIVIPFRNESKNLPKLLNSISLINYPKDKFEILLINDDSSDDFKGIIRDFQSNHTDLILKLIQNNRKSNSPKKDAIETAIRHSNFDWIISTDADCILPKNWLSPFSDFIQKENPKMIVAPVSYRLENRFIEQFQNLEFLSLQGSTIGGFGINRPFLCNGANLCYHKNAFKEVGGFKGNKDIASGDDIFLMEKMITKFPGRVKYIKCRDSIVLTSPERTFSGLIQQRMRWASKTSSYHHKFGKAVGLIVFTTNAYLLLLLIFAIINKISWQHFGLFYLIKFNIDFLLIHRSASFFKQENSLKSYLTSSFLYPFFMVFIALFSFNRSYKWKGRSFKK